MAFLLLLEPTSGATVVMMGAAVAMLFLGGVGMIRFSLLVIARSAQWWSGATQEYRLQRLITFTDPWADQYGAGYQLTQALIASGVANGSASASATAYEAVLPARSAHRLRVLGTCRRAGHDRRAGDHRPVCLRRRACPLHRTLGREARQFFAAYVAWGLAFLWLGQFLINVGVNVGLLPTKA